LGGRMPDPSAEPGGARANVSSYRWQVHCRDLSNTNRSGTDGCRLAMPSNPEVCPTFAGFPMRSVSEAVRVADWVARTRVIFAVVCSTNWDSPPTTRVPRQRPMKNRDRHVVVSSDRLDAARWGVQQAHAMIKQFAIDTVRKPTDDT